LQQAIGGIEGEIRVCLQYFFQAWGARGPSNKYRDMLLHTATEEIGHIEMLATAVALNLESAPATLQETAVESSALLGAVMGGGERPRHTVEGMLQKHLLSTGMAAFPGNADGLPFDCSHVYASGNLAADMFANVTAESTGRLLAVRLFNAAHDDGMRDMLSFLIARDTMHQQQWLAVVEELGATLPCPFQTASTRARKSKSTATCFWRQTATAPGRLPGAGPMACQSTVKGSSRCVRTNLWVRSRFWVPPAPTVVHRSSRSSPHSGPAAADQSLRRRVPGHYSAAVGRSSVFSQPGSRLSNAL